MEGLHVLIRYPGSKDKHLKYLDTHIQHLLKDTKKLCEPFSGTASVTFYALKNKLLDEYIINDVDQEIIALWNIVKKEPERLIQSIKSYKPNIEDFYNWKTQELSEKEEFDIAFHKLVLHQVSFSGLGKKAGGPIGGKSQGGTYKVNARWSPNKLEKTINSCSELLNSVPGVIQHESWDKCLENLPEGYSIYLDPPYYVKGEELYLNGSIDHKNLAEQLRHHKSWLLSYDDAPQIREYYKYANVEPLDITSHLHHKKITDLIIKNQ